MLTPWAIPFCVFVLSVFGIAIAVWIIEYRGRKYDRVKYGVDRPYDHEVDT